MGGPGQRRGGAPGAAAGRGGRRASAGRPPGARGCARAPRAAPSPALRLQHRRQDTAWGAQAACGRLPGKAVPACCRGGANFAPGHGPDVGLLSNLLAVRCCRHDRLIRGTDADADRAHAASAGTGGARTCASRGAESAAPGTGSVRAYALLALAHGGAALPMLCAPRQARARSRCAPGPACVRGLRCRHVRGGGHAWRACSPACAGARARHQPSGSKRGPV